MLKCGVWLGFESGKSWWLQILATKLTLIIHLRHIFVYGIFIRREAKMGKTSKSTQNHANIKHIIIQAGGKGTRLEGLTRNKPKCLVPYDNLPIIFHLFRKFEGAKFTIIADYKIEVLQKYLTIFAKGVDYRILKARNEGTIAGITEAISDFSESEPFMIIWCDLILSKEFELPNFAKNGAQNSVNSTSTNITPPPPHTQHTHLSAVA